MNKYSNNFMKQLVVGVAITIAVFCHINLYSQSCTGSISITGGVTSWCPSSTGPHQLTFSGTIGCSYAWYIDGVYDGPNIDWDGPGTPERRRDAQLGHTYQVIGVNNAYVSDLMEMTSLEPELTVSPSPTICPGQTTQLLASSSTPSTTISWTSSPTLSPGPGNSANVNPTSSTIYTVTATHASCSVSKNIAVGVIPPPVSTFNVGGGGSYCPGEQSGAVITLDGSQQYIIYRLKVANKFVGPSLTGDGKPLFFPGQPDVGTYKVTGTNVCNVTVEMQKSATISTGTLLNAFNVTSTDFCSSLTTAGGSITLDGSQNRAIYQLFDEGVPIGEPKPGKGEGAGTGIANALKWTDLPAGGRYTIRAKPNGTVACPRVMPAQGIIIKKYEALKFPIVGGGSVCDSIPIILTKSQPGVDYDLYKNDDIVQIAPKHGQISNNPIIWKVVDPGLYTVKAKVSQLDCPQEQMPRSVKVLGSPIVKIDVLKYPCTYNFSADISRLGTCGVKNILWDFGDGPGSTSTLFNPFHSYATGTYTVSLNVTFMCGTDTCSTVAQMPITVGGEYEFVDKKIEVQVPRRDQVINTSVSTFSDAWPLPFEIADTTSMNPFKTGERGVWRNESQYAFRATRSLSPKVNIATDGTYQMEYFNWQQSSIEAIPDWIKANTVTKYSPYSYELENKDVMNIYSGAVYDYNGQLLTAHGNNMRNDEMAFTGFENDIAHGSTGNLVFNSEPVHQSISLNVLVGSSHMATINMPINKMPDVDSVDVVAYYWEPGGNLWNGFNKIRIRNNMIVCRQQHPSNPLLSVIILDEAPFMGTWVGSISFRESREGVNNGVRDNSKAHTGGSSLQITSSTVFPQPQLKLDSAKTYFISAWVSTSGSGNTSIPKIGEDIGLQVTINNSEGTIMKDTTFYADGPIIEGWQQVKGAFKVSVSNSTIAVGFRTDTGVTAWFDDLRIHPNNGMMKSYVYNLKDYRLVAILDEQNFASLFYYDNEGNLYLTKKETERGRKTITESVSHIRRIDE